MDHSDRGSPDLSLFQWLQLAPANGIVFGVFTAGLAFLMLLSYLHNEDALQAQGNPQCNKSKKQIEARHRENPVSQFSGKTPNKRESKPKERGELSLPSPQGNGNWAQNGKASFLTKACQDEHPSYSNKFNSPPRNSQLNKVTSSTWGKTGHGSRYSSLSSSLYPTARAEKVDQKDLLGRIVRLENKTSKMDFEKFCTPEVSPVSFRKNIDSLSPRGIRAHREGISRPYQNLLDPQRRREHFNRDRMGSFLRRYPYSERKYRNDKENASSNKPYFTLTDQEAVNLPKVRNKTKSAFAKSPLRTNRTPTKEKVIPRSSSPKSRNTQGTCSSAESQGSSRIDSPSFTAATSPPVLSGSTVDADNQECAEELRVRLPQRDNFHMEITCMKLKPGDKEVLMGRLSQAGSPVNVESRSPRISAHNVDVSGTHSEESLALGIDANLQRAEHPEQDGDLARGGTASRNKRRSRSSVSSTRQTDKDQGQRKCSDCRQDQCTLPLCANFSQEENPANAEEVDGEHTWFRKAKIPLEQSVSPKSSTVMKGPLVDKHQRTRYLQLEELEPIKTSSVRERGKSRLHRPESFQCNVTAASSPSKDVYLLAGRHRVRPLKLKEKLLHNVVKCDLSGDSCGEDDLPDRKIRDALGKFHKHGGGPTIGRWQKGVTTCKKRWNQLKSRSTDSEIGSSPISEKPKSKRHRSVVKDEQGEVTEFAKKLFQPYFQHRPQYNKNGYDKVTAVPATASKLKGRKRRKKQADEEEPYYRPFDAQTSESEDDLRTLTDDLLPPLITYAEQKNTGNLDDTNAGQKRHRVHSPADAVKGGRKSTSPDIHYRRQLKSEVTRSSDRIKMTPRSADPDNPRQFYAGAQTRGHYDFYPDVKDRLDCSSQVIQPRASRVIPLSTLPATGRRKKYGKSGNALPAPPSLMQIPPSKETLVKLNSNVKLPTEDQRVVFMTRSVTDKEQKKVRTFTLQGCSTFGSEKGNTNLRGRELEDSHVRPNTMVTGANSNSHRKMQRHQRDQTHWSSRSKRHRARSNEVNLEACSGELNSLIRSTIRDENHYHPNTTEHRQTEIWERCKFDSNLYSPMRKNPVPGGYDIVEVGEAKVLISPIDNSRQNNSDGIPEQITYSPGAAKISFPKTPRKRKNDLKYVRSNLSPDFNNVQFHVQNKEANVEDRGCHLNPQTRLCFPKTHRKRLKFSEEKAISNSNQALLKKSNDDLKCLLTTICPDKFRVLPCVSKRGKVPFGIEDTSKLITRHMDSSQSDVGSKGLKFKYNTKYSVQNSTKCLLATCPAETGLLHNRVPISAPGRMPEGDNHQKRWQDTNTQVPQHTDLIFVQNPNVDKKKEKRDRGHGTSTRCELMANLAGDTSEYTGSNGFQVARLAKLMTVKPSPAAFRSHSTTIVEIEPRKSACFRSGLDRYSTLEQIGFVHNRQLCPTLRDSKHCSVENETYIENSVPSNHEFQHPFDEGVIPTKLLKNPKGLRATCRGKLWKEKARREVPTNKPKANNNTLSLPNVSASARESSPSGGEKLFVKNPVEGKCFPKDKARKRFCRPKRLSKYSLDKTLQRYRLRSQDQSSCNTTKPSTGQNQTLKGCTLKRKRVSGIPRPTFPTVPLCESSSDIKSTSLDRTQIPVYSRLNLCKYINGLKDKTPLALEQTLGSESSVTSHRKLVCLRTGKKPLVPKHVERNQRKSSRDVSGYQHGLYVVKIQSEMTMSSTVSIPNTAQHQVDLHSKTLCSNQNVLARHCFTRSQRVYDNAANTYSRSRSVLGKLIPLEAPGDRKAPKTPHGLLFDGHLLYTLQVSSTDPVCSDTSQSLMNERNGISCIPSRCLSYYPSGETALNVNGELGKTAMAVVVQSASDEISNTQHASDSELDTFESSRVDVSVSDSQWSTRPLLSYSFLDEIEGDGYFGEQGAVGNNISDLSLDWCPLSSERQRVAEDDYLEDETPGKHSCRTWTFHDSQPSIQLDSEQVSYMKIIPKRKGVNGFKLSRLSLHNNRQKSGRLRGTQDKGKGEDWAVTGTTTSLPSSVPSFLGSASRDSTIPASSSSNGIGTRINLKAPKDLPSSTLSVTSASPPEYQRTRLGGKRRSAWKRKHAARRQLSRSIARSLTTYIKKPKRVDKNVLGCAIRNPTGDYLPLPLAQGARYTPLAQTCQAQTPLPNLPDAEGDGIAVVEAEAKEWMLKNNGQATERMYHAVDQQVSCRLEEFIPPTDMHMVTQLERVIRMSHNQMSPARPQQHTGCLHARSSNSCHDDLESESPQSNKNSKILESESENLEILNKTKLHFSEREKADTLVTKTQQNSHKNTSNSLYILDFGNSPKRGSSPELSIITVDLQEVTQHAESKKKGKYYEQAEDQQVDDPAKLSKYDVSRFQSLPSGDFPLLHTLSTAENCLVQKKRETHNNIKTNIKRKSKYKTPRDISLSNRSSDFFRPQTILQDFTRKASTIKPKPKPRRGAASLIPVRKKTEQISRSSLKKKTSIESIQVSKGFTTPTKGRKARGVPTAHEKRLDQNTVVKHMLDQESCSSFQTHFSQKPVNLKYPLSTSIASKHDQLSQSKKRQQCRKSKSRSNPIKPFQIPSKIPVPVRTISKSVEVNTLLRGTFNDQQPQSAHTDYMDQQVSQKVTTDVTLDSAPDRHKRASRIPVPINYASSKALMTKEQVDTSVQAGLSLGQPSTTNSTIRGKDKCLDMCPLLGIPLHTLGLFNQHQIFCTSPPHMGSCRKGNQDYNMTSMLTSASKGSRYHPPPTPLVFYVQNENLNKSEAKNAVNVEKQKLKALPASSDKSINIEGEGDMSALLLDVSKSESAKSPIIQSMRSAGEKSKENMNLHETSSEKHTRSKDSNLLHEVQKNKEAKENKSHPRIRNFRANKTIPVAKFRETIKKIPAPDTMPTPVLAKFDKHKQSTQTSRKRCRIAGRLAQRVSEDPCVLERERLTAGRQISDHLQQKQLKDDIDKQTEYPKRPPEVRNNKDGHNEMASPTSVSPYPAHAEENMKLLISALRSSETPTQSRLRQAKKKRKAAGPPLLHTSVRSRRRNKSAMTGENMNESRWRKKTMTQEWTVSQEDHQSVQAGRHDAGKTHSRKVAPLTVANVERKPGGILEKTIRFSGPRPIPTSHFTRSSFCSNRVNDTRQYFVSPSRCAFESNDNKGDAYSSFHLSELPNIPGSASFEKLSSVKTPPDLVDIELSLETSGLHCVSSHAAIDTMADVSESMLDSHHIQGAQHHGLNRNSPTSNYQCL
ncbi:uncharacterized protein LOC101864051 [Aplysia californica]|uniref:Uncharacterized protein LOC101864051 n=1 Tax=Aplysia californica TaxID=6500 RepID=A0ABM0JH26_APLCA|nr:uncharacterized protein LOC101864051 [Aplysia californica]